MHDTKLPKHLVYCTEKMDRLFLASVDLPSARKEDYTAAYRVLKCSCGHDVFTIYRLKENVEIEGLAYPDIIYAKCSLCQETYELFNIHKYGWDAFINGTEESRNITYPLNEDDFHSLHCSICGHAHGKCIIAVEEETEENYQDYTDFTRLNGDEITDRSELYNSISIGRLCVFCRSLDVASLNIELS